MVTQIKDSRKARSRPVVVLPRAVFALSGQQILDPALQSVGLVFGCHQTHERPGGLGRCAWPLALATRIIVAPWRLAPSAVGVLNRSQPASSRLVPGLQHVLANTIQSVER